MFYLFLVAFVLLLGACRWLLAAATGFGSVQVSDGYAAAQTLNPGMVTQLQWSASGNIAVGVNKSSYICAFAGSIVDVRAAVGTAPTGTAIVLDLMKNGVTMFTTPGNRPTIAINGTVSTIVLPDVLAVAAGDVLRVDVVQIGSVVTGATPSFSATVRHATIA